MALVLLCSNELRLLARCSAAVQAGGHESRIVPPSSLGSFHDSSAYVCLFDLGPRSGSDLVELLCAIRANPGLQFVALTARPDAQEGLSLLRAGARGYCNRAAKADVVEVVLSSVIDGEIWASRQVTDFLLANALAAAPGAQATSAALLEKLTPREAEIANDVAAGHSNKIIAARQGISERTVKAHLNSIFRKTRLRSRVQLALAINQAETPSSRRSSG